MDKVVAILPSILHRRGLQTHATGALAVYRAAQWLRERCPELHEDLRVATLKDGVLRIRCSHSIALQECRVLSAELLAYLRESCAEAAVREILPERD